MVLQYVKQKVDERYHPDGYNVGINVNKETSQSVFHVHIIGQAQDRLPIR